MNTLPNHSVPLEDQARLLDEVLNVVKIQAHQMKKCLEDNRLMDGLKHCSNMLAELRTSSLTPKTYYELYMAIFDALRHLTVYLIEAHSADRHHLADLYELVQYAGNIVPRLYLMITVGAAYMSVPKAPVREIMRDMMEMTKGVQHPIRGLFLRHYLSGMTRDHLPLGESTGPQGNVHDSIAFVLTNFTEMNKLWVRLQHQGHSRERERREAERKELKILVGTNLVRLSHLEGVDLAVYQTDILPGILDQVVSCRDVIAQEYLMEVITQVFPDDFHLRTLQPFLSATAQLHPKVNVKQIIISLIDRLAAYANRESEEESEGPVEEAVEEPSEKPVEEEKEEPVKEPSEEPAEEEKEETEVVEEQNDESKEDVLNDFNQETEITQDTEEQGKEVQQENVKKVRGIPQDIELFVVFWGQIVELVQARPDLSIQDLTGLLVSLINLSLSCYPEKLDYVEQILAYCKEILVKLSDSPHLLDKTTEANLLALLLSPVTHYGSILTLLSFKHYQPLLAIQPFTTRRTVAHALLASLLRKKTEISTPENIQDVLELCNVLVQDQKDVPTSPNSPLYNDRNNFSDSTEHEEFVEKQRWMAKLVHLFQSDSEDTQLLLLSSARKQFSKGGQRIRYTYPSLVTASITLARRYKSLEHNEAWESKTATLFRFIHQVISTLHQYECATLCLHLFLLAGQSADEIGFEEIAYEFFVEAFTIYEESISDSKAQLEAITSIIGTLQQTSVFSVDNYDTLITKATLHSSKLLKRPDQCRAVYLSSHLWWAAEREKGSQEKEILQNGKKALECLQKALKIADSCMDTITTVELFVEILNRYIYYFEMGNEAVTAKYLNGLIDLINTNLSNMKDPDQHPPASRSSSITERTGPAASFVSNHFHTTFAYLQTRKDMAVSGIHQGPRYEDLELNDEQ
ncbi:vacuolar protein sorting-associated protein 35 [Spinellus fusiger]|nr:vacuolar protein sorting-associated protein 35 [Spinellus fusiger]